MSQTHWQVKRSGEKGTITRNYFQELSFFCYNLMVVYFPLICECDLAFKNIASANNADSIL